jgi:small subunit ribosomal protein S4
MRKLHKKYKRPKRLWDERRIKEESRLKRKYGLKNMRELWIARAELRRVRSFARRLLALPPEEREKLERIVLDKLYRLNILDRNATIDDILSLTVESFLERRLQTIVWKKGLARTPKQARQFIVHGHIAINGRRVTSPGYMVKRGEDDLVGWYKEEIQQVPPSVSPKEENAKEETAPEAEGGVA